MEQTHSGLTHFHATGLFLHPLKTSESQRLGVCFRGIERDQWHEIGECLVALEVLVFAT